MNQADTGGDAVFQIGRYVVDQFFSEVAQGQQYENDTFYQNRGQGDLPRIRDALLHKRNADRVSEVGVESHGRKPELPDSWRKMP